MGEMTALLEEIGALIEAPKVDRAHVERTLTDGYAHALTLEAERTRLQKRVDEMTRDLRGDAVSVRTTELRSLARELDGTSGELSRLRARLAELRRRASD